MLIFILQGCIYIIDVIPEKTLSDAMDLEDAHATEDVRDGETPYLLDEEESAVLVQSMRMANI